jgi:CBS domain-containing protein
MTPNPKSIDERATVRETAEVLQKQHIHIAPVIEAAGRPIGVVSRTDLLDYWGRRRDRLAAVAAGEANMEPAAEDRRTQGDELSVREIMTPVVFGVRTSASITSIIEKILALEVRCLFVTDEHGVLVGTISVFDLLRHVTCQNVNDAETDMLQGVTTPHARPGRRTLASAMPP